MFHSETSVALPIDLRRLNPVSGAIHTSRGSIRRRTFPAADSLMARGLVRVRNPDGTIRAWVERSDIDAVLDEGWTLE